MLGTLDFGKKRGYSYPWKYIISFSMPTE